MTPTIQPAGSTIRIAIATMVLGQVKHTEIVFFVRLSAYSTEVLNAAGGRIFTQYFVFVRGLFLILL